MTFKQFVFKYRGQLPVPLALALIYSAEPGIIGMIYGTVIIIFGELFRLTALRSIGAPSRTRNAGAPRLVTWGLYARVRNPLYIGNVLIYSGLVVFGGGPWMIWLFLLMLLYFFLQYAVIIDHEESILAEKFGNEYEEYRKAVPRILPSFRAGKYDTAAMPSAVWQRTLRIERHSLISLSIIYIMLLIKYFI